MTKAEQNLVCEWFGHLEQLATDRKTQTGAVMSYEDCMAEMASLAHNCKHFIEEFGDSSANFEL